VNGHPRTTTAAEDLRPGYHFESMYCASAPS
jgi:hypothetical protein